MNECSNGYSMEELLPVVAWLTRKYTSNESTSITYEKARQLMGAVRIVSGKAKKEIVRRPKKG